ncbi:MAG TPA: class I SAM-dependent methyltransferase [Stellaceae bacterium]|nr:class I SAM-dependent methyltransferase [Stellaceae bacterium]
MPLLLRPALVPSLIGRAVRRTIAWAAERRYDRALGIDTGGEIVGKRLMMTPDGEACAKGYAGTPPSIAEHLIGMVADRARGFTFVDYGAGKGRVLLIAAGYPFGRVVGVELSEPLTRIAATNIAAYARSHPGLVPIELVHASALNYQLPLTPCVLFFYDPFEESLMERIGQQVLGSFLAHPRKMFFIYYSPAFGHVFEAPFTRRHDVTDLLGGPMNRYGKPTASIFETLLE